MISMKVCKTDLNKISLHSIILQLQLTLELSQFKEILSVYSDLLVLVANYSFIFENSSSEIQALKENPVSVETALITSDPIRDGLNWWNYCNGNPLSFVDWMGLEPKINNPKGTVMYSPGKNPYNYPKTFEEWSNNVKDFWINLAKNTDLIPEGHTQVLIIRPNDGYGDDFDSLRVAIKNTNGKIDVLTQMVGANCVNDLVFIKKHNGYTRRDGDYYYTTEGLIPQNDGSYNSGSFKNVLKAQTEDSRFSEEYKKLINEDCNLSHPNQYADAPYEYNINPRSASCDVVKGQSAQDEYMDFINYHVADDRKVDNVSIKFISGVY